MNGKQEQTAPLDSTWRAILPVHWLPVIFYLEWLIALRCASAIVEEEGVGFELELAIDLLHLGACGALVCLAMLLQLPATKRVSVLLALWLLFSLMEVAVLVVNDRSLPLSGVLHELARESLEKLRLVAILAALMQALSAALGFFVTTNQPTPHDFVNARQSKIADWLLWMLLFSLCFLPTLSRWRPPPLPGELITIDGEPWFPEIGYAIGVSGLMGIALWGLFILTAGINWRLRVFVLGLVAITQMGVVGYLMFTFQPDWSLGLYLGSSVYQLACTLPAIPSWLLLRCAGYRGYSARRAFHPPRLEPRA